MHSYTIYFYFLCVMSLSFSSSYFLGGTIHWMSLPSPENATLFTYRLAWQKSTGPCGPGCDTSKIGKQGDVSSPSLSNLTWQCSMNCGSRTGLWEINYVLTSVSHSSDGWEQGEGSFQHTFNGTGPFNVWFKYFPWIPSGHSLLSELGYMDTIIDLRKRNDTNLPNSSPYVSLQSIIGVQLNCPTVIQLPVYDPDGDIVRCRWTEPQECGNACTNVPINTVRLNKVNCSLTINAYSFQGYTSNETYRLTIMVEDFSDHGITLGSDSKNKETSLSSIPLQLTLRIIDVSQEYRSLMTFVRPTPRPLRITYTNQNLSASTTVRVPFFVETPDKRTTDFQVSAPASATYSIFDDDVRYGRPNVTKIMIEWLPKWTQIGDYQICVWSTDQYGLTSSARCLTEIVQDDRDCPSPTVACNGNGQCINLFKREVCKCNQGFLTPKCTSASRCLDSPCYNNATCSDSGTGYICHCAAKYTGPHCEYEIDACDLKPCLNGGTCITLQEGYQCVCRKDFSGIICEEDVHLSSTSISTRILPTLSVSNPSTDVFTTLSSTIPISTTLVTSVSKADTSSTVPITVSSYMLSKRTSTITSTTIATSRSKGRSTTTVTMSRPTMTTLVMSSTPSSSTKMFPTILNCTTRSSPVLSKYTSHIPMSSSTDGASKKTSTTVTKLSTHSSTTNLSSMLSTFDSSKTMSTTEISSSDNTTTSSFTSTARVSRDLSNLNNSRNTPSTSFKFSITSNILTASSMNTLRSSLTNKLSTRSYTSSFSSSFSRNANIPLHSTKVSSTSQDMRFSSLNPASPTTSVRTSSSSANIFNGNMDEYTADRTLNIMQIVVGVLAGLVGLGLVGVCLWMIIYRPCWNRKKEEERVRKPSREWLNAGQTDMVVRTPGRLKIPRPRAWLNAEQTDMVVRTPGRLKIPRPRVRKESRVEPIEIPTSHMEYPNFEPDISSPPPKLRKPGVSRVRKESTVELLGEQLEGIDNF